MNMISPGFYDAVVFPVDTDEGPQKVQFGFTKEGRKQISICFEILDGEHAGLRLNYFGFFGNQPSNGKNPTTATERTIRSLRACGFKGDDLSTVNEQALDQKVSVTVEHNDYNGKVTARVAWVNAPGGGGFKLSAPMKKDDMRKFAAEMKMAVRGIPDAPGEKAVRGGRTDANDRGDDPMTDQRRSTGNPPKGIDDEIPF